MTSRKRLAKGGQLTTTIPIRGFLQNYTVLLCFVDIFAIRHFPPHEKVLIQAYRALSHENAVSFSELRMESSEVVYACNV